MPEHSVQNKINNEVQKFFWLMFVTSLKNSKWSTQYVPAGKKVNSEFHVHTPERLL